MVHKNKRSGILFPPLSLCNFLHTKERNRQSIGFFQRLPVIHSLCALFPVPGLLHIFSDTVPKHGVSPADVIRPDSLCDCTFASHNYKPFSGSCYCRIENVSAKHPPETWKHWKDCHRIFTALSLMYRNRICQCQRPIVFLLIFHDPRPSQNLHA